MNLISLLIIVILCVVVLFLIRVIRTKNHEFKVLKSEYVEVYRKLSTLREQIKHKKNYAFDIFDQTWDDNTI